MPEVKTEEPVYNLFVTVRYSVSKAFTHSDLHKFSTDNQAIGWLLSRDVLQGLADNAQGEILHTGLIIDREIRKELQQ